MTVEEQVQDAVQISIAQFAHEHPATYTVLTERLGDPVTFVIDGLKRDEAYQALVAQTNEEVDIANIIKVLIPVVLRIAEAALGLL